LISAACAIQQHRYLEEIQSRFGLLHPGCMGRAASAVEIMKTAPYDD